MQEYDVTLKSILSRPGSVLLAAITGVDHLRWLNVETPRVKNLRADMLGEAANGDLIQIEFQSRNFPDMPFRMVEYLGAVGRVHNRLPRQIVLYVGEPKLSMKDEIRGPDSFVRYHLIDIRELDGEALLASGNLSDNVIALLTRIGTRPDTVQRIVSQVMSGPPEERGRAAEELMILAGLRKKSNPLAKELSQMPITEDIMDNPYVGPWLRKARVEGRVEGQIELLLGLLRKRFGAVPAEVQKRLTMMTPAELQEAGLRLFDVNRIEDIFPN